MHQTTTTENHQLAHYRIDTGRHFHLEIIADRAGGNALTLAQETKLLCRNLSDLIKGLGVENPEADVQGLASTKNPSVPASLLPPGYLCQVVPLPGIVEHLRVPSEMAEVLEDLRRGEDGTLDTSPIGGDPDKDYAAALQLIQLGLQALDEALPNGQRTRTAVGYESVVIGVSKLAEFLKTKGLFDNNVAKG